MTLEQIVIEGASALVGAAAGGSATVLALMRRVARAEAKKVVRPIVERVELLESAQDRTVSAVVQLRKVVNAHE